MMLKMFKGKIHRAVVTDSDLNYVGSITIDKTLLKASTILPGECVQVVCINTGARFETYVIEGEADSGVVCINGAAARLVQTGDLIIIIAYCQLFEEELDTFNPKTVFVDKKNRISQAVVE